MPYDTQTGLPFASGSHESWSAAVKASATRETKTRAYLQLLRKRGPLTDDEVARATRWPRSSVCSIRNGAVKCGLVEKGFTTRESQYGVQCRTWCITKAGKAAVAAMRETQ